MRDKAWCRSPVTLEAAGALTILSPYILPVLPFVFALVRQKGPVADHNFEIQFLDPGVQAFGFTFG